MRNSNCKPLNTLNMIARERVALTRSGENLLRRRVLKSRPLGRVTRYSENGLDLGAARERSRDTAFEEMTATISSKRTSRSPRVITRVGRFASCRGETLERNFTAPWAGQWPEAGRFGGSSEFSAAEGEEVRISPGRNSPLRNLLSRSRAAP